MILIKKNIEDILYEVDSKSELKEFIKNNNGIIIGGQDVQIKSNFYVVEFLFNEKSSWDFK